MTNTLRLSEDQWMVKNPIDGPNFYCLSLVFMRNDHISHCASGVFSTSFEEASKIVKTQTLEQFPESDGWVLIGIAGSRVMFTSTPLSNSG